MWGDVFVGVGIVEECVHLTDKVHIDGFNV